jgi:hypothetical protein
MGRDGFSRTAAFAMVDFSKSWKNRGVDLLTI